MVDADGEDEEKIMEHILSELRLNGLISLEPEVYQQMDVGLAGRSEVLPLTLKTDGTPAKKGTSGAGRRDFQAMTVFVNRKICDAAEKSCLVILISDRFRWSRKPAAITVRIIVCVALIRKFRDSPMKKIRN